MRLTGSRQVSLAESKTMGQHYNNNRQCLFGIFIPKSYFYWKIIIIGFHLNFQKNCFCI